MFGNTLIDNSTKLKLVNTLNEIISMPEINEICIATGYWDLKGTSLVTESLINFLSRQNTKLRLLIGKDPNVFKKDLTSEAYKTAKIYPQDYLKIDLQNIEMNDENYQKAAKMLIDNCSGDNPKIQVHIFEMNEDDERQFFHSKCYIFTDGTDDNSFGIVGSSNFTEKGLNGNSELNYLETNGMIVNHHSSGTKKGHIQWFNEKWELSKDWTKEFVIEIGNSPVGIKAKEKPAYSKDLISADEGIILLSPRETYYKLLISQFNSYLEYDGKIQPDDFVPSDPNFKKLDYQIQAVNQAFSILEKHHGMMLADVVGLGKTFSALMIVKRALIKNAFSKPILIITPPAIKKSWQDSIDYFDKDAENKISGYITLTTIGCLDSESASDDENFVETDDFDSSFIKKDYGMVVVDESHRFRNSGTIMYQKLDDLLAEKNPFVVLLSATPQNNRPMDIANQLYLFERDKRHSTITGLGRHENNLESYFSEKEKLYEECIRDWSGKDSEGKKIPKTKEQKKLDMQKLKELSDQIRDDVLNQLVIRRTRTDLQSDLYKDDIKKQGIVFPKIQPPEGLPYEMTGSLAQLFVHTLDVIAPKVSHIDVDENGMQEFDFREEGINCLGYYRYRAIQYLKDAKNRKRYEYDSKRNREASGSITVEDISERLAGLMELHLVKRLESSRNAFEESLQNLYQNTNNMIRMFENDRIFICPDFDIHKILNSYSENDTEKAFADIKAKAVSYNQKHQTERNAEYKASDFKDEYIQNLKNDAELIGKLVDDWAKNKQDKKRDTFVKNIESKFLNKKNNPSQKIVVFTECIATQNMLYDFLNDEYPNQVLKITAKNRKDMQEILEANFDANYKGTPQDTYKILVTTDVLAEGVNLHRANTLINYDSPWNSTRLMQRLGRINRIGSKSEKIYSYNFYPSTLGDNQINLYKRTLVKLQAFHNMFGEDSQIYTQDEELVEIERPIFEEAESLDPKIEFITDLLNFKKEQPEKYEELCVIPDSKTIATAVQAEDATSSTAKCHAVVEGGFFKLNESTEFSFVSPNLIDFFRTVKSVSEKTLAELSQKEYADFKHKCVLAYLTQKSNDSVSIKSKNKTNEKDRVSAIGKVKDIAKQYKLDSSTKTLLRDIETSVRANNAPIIRRVVSENCENLLEIDSIIKSWHDLLSKPIMNGNEKAEPKVQFEIIEV